MIKYNYMRIEPDKEKSPINQLNTLGVEGWEAFAVTKHYIYLKKSIISDGKEKK